MALDPWMPRARRGDPRRAVAEGVVQPEDLDRSGGSLDAHGFIDEKQRADLVYTVGQYTQVSMLLNSVGVQPDAGLVVDPALDGR